MFSVVYAMLLRPFPFENPRDIVAIVSTNPQQNVGRAPLSFGEFTELSSRRDSFAEIAGYAETTLTFSGGTLAQQVQGATVSADLFPLLGAEPILGRPFLPGEDRPGAPGTVLLGHALWLRDFDGDPSVTGRWLRIDGVPHQVVGVMPPRFRFPSQQQAWVPLAPRLADRPEGVREVEVLARLKPGTSLAQAQLESSSLGERLAKQAPETEAGWTWKTMPLRDLFVSPGMRIMSLTMMGAAIFVLLIACANVANLLLSRAIRRRREIVLRTVLGASPARITRQLLTESMLLAAGGGLLGIVLALVAVRGLSTLLEGAQNVPYWLTFSVDFPVLAFTAAAAVATGVIFGLVPALQAARVDLSSLLNQARSGIAGGGGGSRFRSALVVAEIALSAILLIGGALFVRSFVQLQDVETGFDDDRLLTLRAYLPGERYEDPAERLRWTRQALDHLVSLPEVDAAYASPFVPLAGGMRISVVEVAGQEAPAQSPRTYWAGVTPGFFGTLGVPLEVGRDFAEAEAWEESPVAVVNRLFVKRFFPDSPAVGRRFRLADAEDAPWLTVIGVVGTFKIARLDEPGSPAVYLPYAFSPPRDSGLVVRTQLDPAQLGAAVKREVQAVDHDVPLLEVATMGEIRDASTWQFQVVSKIFSIFGALALLLAGIGLYGVISHMVGQRSGEIGVRMALGAQRRQVLGLIMRQGLRLAAFGVLIGGVGAFLLSQVLSSFLYGIGAADPISFVGLTVFLLLVAALASYLPAIRATTIDPTAALRGE
jgi:putative ABC transport system permease protein